MDNSTNVVFAAPPEYVGAASQTGLPVAYMIYRIGRGYHLFRAKGLDWINGGIMVLDTDGYSGGGPLSALISEILGECMQKGFHGIILDSGGKSSKQLAAMASRLAQDAMKRGIRLYVHDVLAYASDKTVVLVPTALSGGTLSGYLDDAVNRFGKERVALEIDRVRMDFTLPASSGTGKELRAGELQALMDTYHPQSFLSRDLCAYYFTYHDKNGTHFVLYDNAASIRRKLSVAAKMGIDSAFIYYPNVTDIIEEIRSE